MGIAPLVTSTLSDTFKIRRILYLAFAAVFTMASIGGGFSRSAAGLVLARVFQAVGSGGATILGAGTVTDIYVRFISRWLYMICPSAGTLVAVGTEPTHPKWFFLVKFNCGIKRIGTS